MKRECLHFFANLVCDLDQNLLTKLVDLNLIRTLHDVIYDEPNNAWQEIYALQTLDTIFTQVPDQKEKFLQRYGTEAIEQLQFSKNQEVVNEVLNFLTRHFECDEENDLEDAPNNEQGVFQI